MDSPILGRRALTRREVQVLTTLSDGSSYAVAAHRLGVAVHTIKTHLTAIYRKLDAASLVEAYHNIGWLRPGGVAASEYAELELDIEARLEAIRNDTTALVAELRGAA